MNRRLFPMPEAQVVNGINVTGLGEVIETFTAQPELAKCTFHAHNRWVDCGHNRTVIQDFEALNGQEIHRPEPFVLNADEPPALMGHDLGANPVEALLHALAACITTSFVYHMAAKGIKLQSVESELEGDIDLRGLLGITDEVRNGFQQIRVRFKVEADGVSRDRLQALLKLGPDHSPVFDMVTHEVPVAVELVE
jgi:uncharacterized OsmC-like protein